MGRSGLVAFTDLPTGKPVDLVAPWTNYWDRPPAGIYKGICFCKFIGGFIWFRRHLLPLHSIL